MASLREDKMEQERLLQASRGGDVAAVRALLESGVVAVDAVDDWYGRTSLHIASSWGHLQVMEVLLTAGADLHTVDKKGWTPLHHASGRGQSHAVELLLKAGADPQTATTDGLTPLHSAASWGHWQVVEQLLKAGADPTAADKKDIHTPLHFACEFAQSEVVRALLASGADLHAKDIDGYEPLHFCIRPSGFSSLPTAKILETLQELVSFGATWDDTCDELVASGDAWKAAPALRICMSLWSQELADGLPTTDIPLEVIGRGADSTQAYIDDLQKSVEVVLRRKICLVGPSCAGKTSFVKSIISKLPQLAHLDDRTIGIDHFPLRFEESSTDSEKRSIHEVTFWDFAGQDAYQVAHSLFFSPRTLFLVCVDLEAFTTAVLQASIMSHVKKQETQLMDEFIDRTVMHWIRLIVARQPDAEFVFIATKEDLLTENNVTEQLFKKSITAKLKEVVMTVQQMRDQLVKDRRLEEIPNDGSDPNLNQETTPVGVSAPEPTVLLVSCTSVASVQAARTRIEDLIVQSKRSFQMPDTYSQALEAILKIRQAVNAKEITTRIKSVFVPVDSLPARLQLEPELCRSILGTLHDLGDVLWYKDVDVELFQNTVILDPLLLIDFIRQVVNHTHTGVTMSHADLKAKPFWIGLSNEQQMQAMKQLLQKFRLVYPDDEDGVMHWDSDLIVPAFWQTKTPASWLFLGDILRINSTKSCEGEAVRVEWEYHFEFGLPSALFDQVVVTSVSPCIKFEAGPDWIVYEEKEIAACRIMVGRDVKSLHRTIHVEAVVAEAANEDQVEELWWTFEQLCSAFISVMDEYPGLAGVSSFAWDDNHTKINLKRLVQSKRPLKTSAAKWMPPAATWAWYKQLVTKSA